MKYIKKVKIAPNFKIEFEILSQGPRKKFGPKIKKKLPSAMGGTRQSGLCRVPAQGHSAKLIFKNKKNCRVPERWHSAK